MTTDVRGRLVELLREVQYLGGLEEKIADHLIANGVTVQECCHKAESVISKIAKECPNCGAKMIGGNDWC